MDDAEGGVDDAEDEAAIGSGGRPCPLCETPMYHRHCKYVCPAHGGRVRLLGHLLLTPAIATREPDRRRSASRSFAALGERVYRVPNHAVRTVMFLQFDSYVMIGDPLSIPPADYQRSAW